MEDKTKITYPDSEKVYMQGELFPYLKVGMRKVNLTPTVVVENGKKIITENAPVYIYDTSGAYSDPNQKVDLKKGPPPRTVDTGAGSGTADGNQLRIRQDAPGRQEPRLSPF